MAQDGDAENQTNTNNEQTPLLEDHQSDQQPDQNEPEPELECEYRDLMYQGCPAKSIL
jgi:hypothetical protein